MMIQMELTVLQLKLTPNGIILEDTFGISFPHNQSTKTLLQDSHPICQTIALFSNFTVFFLQNIFNFISPIIVEIQGISHLTLCSP